MPCHQLIYHSRPTFDVSANILLDILERSQKNNDARKVSGVLVYHHGRFIQLLEGRSKSVGEIMDKIRHDPRHTDIQVVLDADVDGQPLCTWLMGFGSEDFADSRLGAQTYCFSLDEIKKLLQLKGGAAGEAFLRLLAEVENQ